MDEDEDICNNKYNLSSSEKNFRLCGSLIYDVNFCDIDVVFYKLSY